MRRLQVILYVLGIILISLSLILPELSIGASGEVMERVQGAGLIFGGLVVILVARRLGKGERPQDKPREKMKIRTRLVLTLIMVVFIAVQFTFLY